MTALINDPNAHRPHGPRLGFGYLEDSDRPEGNFYQPPGEDQLKLLDELPRRAEAPDFAITIDDYQAWCELNWKAPHGTVTSNTRLVDKLFEENTELKESFYHNSSAQELVSELGDILWCATAIASDLKVNVKHGLMELFYLYGRGTVIFETAEPPEWVKQAQVLTFNKSLQAGDIDEMVAKGYEPQASPVMYTDDSPMLTELELEDAVNNIEINSLMLSSIARMNYEPDLYQSGATQRGDEIACLVAKMYIDVAFIARHRTDASLVEVIRANIRKLSNRVDNNLIDKSDGTREDQSLY